MSSNTSNPNPSELLRGLFGAALEAALPANAMRSQLPPPPSGKTIVLGAGKAAASMAVAIESQWNGPLEGLVVTRYGHAVPTRHVEVVEAAHPVPDEAGQAATRRILDLAHSATADDLVICLMSGGASALLSLPVDGLTLADKQAVNAELLRCGAPIDEMNCVRKRLSAIKGGRLGAAIAPARAVTLLISDVPGDSPAVIGSGPTVADPTPASAALEIVERYGLQLPDHVMTALAGTPTVDQLPDNQSIALVATPQMSLEAAAQFATANGIQPMILGDAIEGEAREAAKVLAGVAKQVTRHGQPLPRPCVLLSGGETTVTVKQSGRGGRNSEFLLGLALALEGEPGVHAIACDTDGIDGSEENAGALVGPDTLARAAAAGLDARALLEANDAYGFFAGLDDLVVTGPILTNVNDFRAILIL